MRSLVLITREISNLDFKGCIDAVNSDFVFNEISNNVST